MISEIQLFIINHVYGLYISLCLRIYRFISNFTYSYLISCLASIFYMKNIFQKKYIWATSSNIDVDISSYYYWHSKQSTKKRKINYSIFFQFQFGKYFPECCAPLTLKSATNVRQFELERIILSYTELSTWQLEVSDIICNLHRITFVERKRKERLVMLCMEH